MTYGQIRLRLVQLAPGVGTELLDGWIQGRYTEMLDALPWKRLESQSIFPSPASYQTGTIAATQGSASIVGTGTAWDESMTGAVIRISNGTEFYTFTWVDPTHGTLDRGFEQPTASGLTYRIDRATFVLPDGCRILRGVKPLHGKNKGLEMISPAELDRRAPHRPEYGTPTMAAATWDTQIDPPALQVELYPIPNSPDTTGVTLSFEADYVYDPADLDARQTSVSLLPWARPEALIEGVQASIDYWRASSNPDKAGAFIASGQAHEKRFGSLLQQMARINATQRGPQPMQLAPELQRQFPGYYRRGPWHRGGTG